MFFRKFIILFCIIHEIYGLSYDIMFNKFEVMPETDPEFIDFGTMRIVKKNRKEVELSGQGVLYHKLTNVGVLTLIAHRLNKRGLPPLQVFFSSGGWCDQIASDQYLYPNLLEHSNFPKDFCPLQPGNYTLKNLVVHMDKFPDMLPMGEYMGKLTYTLNHVVKASIVMTVSIISKSSDE